MNYNTITLHTAKRFLVAHIQKMLATKKYGEPIMLHSSPGVGKSSIIFQTGFELKDAWEDAFQAKFKIWDIRVGAQQESDIQGIPFPSDVERVQGVIEKDMMFSTPSWWPKEDECGILLMDELANAPIPNQHACYRVVHDRSIHNGKELPPGVIVLAAGNLKEDKTGAKGIVPALARRFMAHLVVQPSVEEFITYGLERNIHPTVMSYLGTHTDKIVTKAAAGEYGFGCPANWESISNLLHNEFMEEDLKEIGVTGCIGTALGTDFVGFRRNERFFPNFKKVEETGEYTLPNDDDFDRGAIWSVVMATTVRLVHHLDKEAPTDEDKKRANNLTAILREMDISTAAIAFRTLKASNKKLISLMLRDKELKDISALIAEVIQRAASMQ